MDPLQLADANGFKTIEVTKYVEGLGWTIKCVYRNIVTAADGTIEFRNVESWEQFEAMLATKIERDRRLASYRDDERIRFGEFLSRLDADLPDFSKPGVVIRNPFSPPPDEDPPEPGTPYYPGGGI